ncbi:hypothetical protein FHT97_004958 [Rhizobium sp. BK399]|nr:hypothetical protein [Rhizobium sp. BK399]
MSNTPKQTEGVSLNMWERYHIYVRGWSWSGWSRAALPPSYCVYLGTSSLLIAKV